jgi:hypothetical protein
MMGFEKVVLDKVQEVLGTDTMAEFFNGTLFLNAEEKDARRVFSMLCKEYDFKVLPSKVGDQFAYDFI